MDLKNIANTDIYEFQIENNLTKQEAKNLTQSFEEFESRGQKVKLLGVLNDVPTPKNIDSVREIFGMKVSALEVIEKYAVLSEKKWINDWVPIGNFFTPTIPIKTFAMDNRQAAIDWLNEDKVEEYDAQEFLADIDIKKTQENTFEIVVSEDKINHASMLALYDLFDEVEEGKKINLLLQIDSIPSIENFKTLMEGLKIDFKAFGRLNKYAVVSESKWIEGYSKVGDFLTPGIDMKGFNKSELEEAREWINK